jgi:hypothetical protein
MVALFVSIGFEWVRVNGRPFKLHSATIWIYLAVPRQVVKSFSNGKIAARKGMPRGWRAEGPGRQLNRRQQRRSPAHMLDRRTFFMEKPCPWQTQVFASARRQATTSCGPAPVHSHNMRSRGAPKNPLFTARRRGRREEFFGCKLFPPRALRLRGEFYLRGNGRSGQARPNAFSRSRRVQRIQVGRPWGQWEGFWQLSSPASR